MSMPNIPDISPEICLKMDDILKLLLSSVALQEIGLSHIINAEGEKIQSYLRKYNKFNQGSLSSLDQNTEKILREVSNLENILLNKLEKIEDLYKLNHINIDKCRRTNNFCGICNN